jgi:hypothetical protein
VAGSGRRVVKTISLSPANPDAAVVLAALAAIPEGEHSKMLLAWAAAYLEGRARAAAADADPALDEAAIDAALDDF